MRYLYLLFLAHSSRLSFLDLESESSFLEKNGKLRSLHILSTNSLSLMLSALIEWSIWATIILNLFIRLMDYLNNNYEVEGIDNLDIEDLDNIGNIV